MHGNALWRRRQSRPALHFGAAVTAGKIGVNAFKNKQSENNRYGLQCRPHRDAKGVRRMRPAVAPPRKSSLPVPDRCRRQSLPRNRLTRH